MSDLDPAEWPPVCEHDWIFHMSPIGVDLLVGICSRCREPNWDVLREQVDRLKANQMPDDGEWTWLYGFKASDGKFHTYGSATTPRRQNLYGDRLYRQRAFLAEVEPIPEAAE